MYEPSTAQAGVAKLIASLLDTPASRLASRGKNALPMTHGTCGHTLPASPVKSNPSGVFSRTSPTIYRWDLNRSAMTWATWVTKLRQACLARKKWVRRTAASGCSSWPTVRVSSANGASQREIAAGNPKQRLEVGVVNWATPNTLDHLPQRSAEAMERLMGKGGHREGSTRPSNLREQILWPTPRAQKVSSENPDAWSARQQAGKVATPPLPLAAAMWPTITAQDAKNNAGASQFQRNTKPLNVEAALHCSHPTPTATGAASQPILNPAFTEWLMGWPIGWTESVPAVTGWCRWQQHMRGALSVLALIRIEHERLAHPALPA
jgi:hypothetical protein